MKRNVIFAFIILLSSSVSRELYSQNVYPVRKIMSPEKVVLSHACMMGTPVAIDQDPNFAFGEPSEALIYEVKEDHQGNLYFTGYADYSTRTPSDPKYAVAGSGITFGSNTSAPLEVFRTEGIDYIIDHQKFFIWKCTPDGNPLWVKFFNEQPLKMYLDSTESAVHLLFKQSGNGLLFDGVDLYLDSNYQSENKGILSLNQSNGNFKSFYQPRFLRDFYMQNGKKFIIYGRQLTQYIFDNKIGFWANGAVYKWINIASTSAISQLYYNPYENNWWYINSVYFNKWSGLDKDTIIYNGKNIAVKYLFPESQYGAMPKRLFFLKNGNYITEHIIQPFTGNLRRYLYCQDTAGKNVWTIKFPNSFEEPVFFDEEDRMYLDFANNFYYDKLESVPSGKSYFAHSYGNSGVYPSANLWRFNTNNGELDDLFQIGMGNINRYYVYPGANPNFITSGNKLICSPKMRSVCYYPDKQGNFVKYNAECSNKFIPSQFHWAFFDLKNLSTVPFAMETAQSLFPVSEQVKIFTVGNTLVLKTKVNALIELYDANGRVIRRFDVKSGVEYRESNLPGGIYMLRVQNSSFAQKVFIAG